MSDTARKRNDEFVTLTQIQGLSVVCRLMSLLNKDPLIIVIFFVPLGVFR
jgi:hypothetical protein